MFQNVAKPHRILAGVLAACASAGLFIGAVSTASASQSGSINCAQVQSEYNHYQQLEQQELAQGNQPGADYWAAKLPPLVPDMQACGFMR